MVHPERHWGGDIAMNEYTVLLTWDHLILEYDKNTLDILLNCIYTIVL
jgi:hypothetical protein